MDKLLAIRRLINLFIAPLIMLRLRGRIMGGEVVHAAWHDSDGYSSGWYLHYRFQYAKDSSFLGNNLLSAMRQVRESLIFLRMSAAIHAQIVESEIPF